MADSENDDRVDAGRPPLHTRFRQGGSPVTPAGAAPRACRCCRPMRRTRRSP